MTPLSHRTAPHGTLSPAVPLRQATLGQLPKDLEQPRYDRSRTASGIVHIGVGGFNRSHLAVYLDDLLNRGESSRWGEFGVGLLPPDLALHASLVAQDYLYGLLQVESDRQNYRIIGSMTGHLYAPDRTEEVLDKLSSPDCAIVSLTVTEGGYFIQDASGRFTEDHPHIRHDLEFPETPITWLGYVAEAASRRRRRGGAPFTVLSCDNLQANGATARKALMAFAEARGGNLRAWMEANISFPNSMVDRITPRTASEDQALIEREFGVLDRAPVVSEPFRQWVLEDHFAAGRPAWELVGAQMTSDVAPYEMTKMRLLNGGHSTIGYPAALLGYTSIAEAMADPLLQSLLVRFMDEVRPTVPVLPGIDLDAYTATIVQRFANTAMRDQVARICSDGCAKIAKFIVPSWADLLAANASPQIIPLVIAAWLYALRGHDEKNRSLRIADPALASMAPFTESGCENARLALSVQPVFGDLAQKYPHLSGAVQRNLDAFRKLGVRATLRRRLNQLRTQGQ